MALVASFPQCRQFVSLLLTVSILISASSLSGTLSASSSTRTSTSGRPRRGEPDLFSFLFRRPDYFSSAGASANEDARLGLDKEDDAKSRLRPSAPSELRLLVSAVDKSTESWLDSPRDVARNRKDREDGTPASSRTAPAGGGSGASAVQTRQSFFSTTPNPAGKFPMTTTTSPSAGFKGLLDSTALAEASRPRLFGGNLIFSNILLRLANYIETVSGAVGRGFGCLLCLTALGNFDVAGIGFAVDECGPPCLDGGVFELFQALGASLDSLLAQIAGNQPLFQLF